jgi:hypothetical protein
LTKAQIFLANTSPIIAIIPTNISSSNAHVWLASFDFSF